MSSQTRTTSIISVLVILIITVALVVWLMNKPEHGHDESAGHDEHSEEEAVVKGPHGGRLLQQDNFSIEITIFETGIPPEFRIYAYHDGLPVPPEKVDLTIILERLGGINDNITFRPEQDYLRGSMVIYEPHSFVVNINAGYESNRFSWRYDNFEGRTQIPAKMAEEMGIRTETVGPGVITETLELRGRIISDPSRIANIRPRYAGVIKSIRFEQGDTVRKGDVLATVQSNESLQTYSVKSPISGVVVMRQAQVGENTSDEPLFIIADLSKVWVELDVYPRDIPKVKNQQTVFIETLDGEITFSTSINWISPVALTGSQVIKARASLDNSNGDLRLGQFVRGDVVISEREVPIAVRRSAIQRFRDFMVVFVRIDDFYEVRMLDLGSGNNEWVEVLGGIDPGLQYVTENSYLLKADIEKSGASHDH